MIDSSAEELASRFGGTLPAQLMAEAPTTRLEVRGLRKNYGARRVVHDVSLDVASGEVVGLLGPNGAGKTTSFYMIVGLVRADAGTAPGVTLADLDLAEVTRARARIPSLHHDREFAGP